MSGVHVDAPCAEHSVQGKPPAFVCLRLRVKLPPLHPMARLALVAKNSAELQFCGQRAALAHICSAPPNGRAKENPQTRERNHRSKHFNCGSQSVFGYDLLATPVQPAGSVNNRPKPSMLIILIGALAVATDARNHERCLHNFPAQAASNRTE
jgi:hypothetical protein